MGVSVMGVLPELGLNTQSSGSSPHAVTELPIDPGTRLRAALYRESGLVRRRGGVIGSGFRDVPVSTQSGPDICAVQWPPLHPPARRAIARVKNAAHSASGSGVAAASARRASLRSRNSRGSSPFWSAGAGPAAGRTFSARSRSSFVARSSPEAACSTRRATIASRREGRRPPSAVSGAGRSSARSIRANRSLAWRGRPPGLPERPLRDRVWIGGWR